MTTIITDYTVAPKNRFAGHRESKDCQIFRKVVSTTRSRRGHVFDDESVINLLSSLVLFFENQSAFDKVKGKYTVAPFWFTVLFCALL